MAEIVLNYVPKVIDRYSAKLKGNNLYKRIIYIIVVRVCSYLNFSSGQYLANLVIDK